MMDQHGLNKENSFSDDFVLNRKQFFTAAALEPAGSIKWIHLLAFYIGKFDSG